MIDATPSATPMPVPPVTTVTSTQAPFPPLDPLPHAVGPAVTEPVSCPDFLPVDDAFALEMRAQSIEQLAGGDALRRGESERIEAGRSQTNADRVAGRDRVRVQGSLHEHTGHGLAEQAAHLHTTVEGTLDVHAASEDTVLLAGHMSDVWDGGAAIVAAMTDDTVAGGGIRVTTPLDLWVHAVMGVEERIGTCTADAVLLELGATHCEREYGPGVHAAGLAAYTGSLYQSSRSTVRPLMRVSSGVRNLIAGGDGGDGGDGGGDGSAGGAPAASPPPVPAQTGATAQAVTRTLAAGRSAAQAPGTALGTADGLTGARRVSLETLEDSVDARAAEEMGEAGTVVRAENLPGLTRSSDTAAHLEALQETLRIDGAEAGSEVAGGFRGSEVQGAVSMHPASGGGGPLEIEPPSADHGENAPMVRPHPDLPWSRGPEMKLGLLGGADHPPRSAAPKSDFLAANHRMRRLRRLCNRRSKPVIAYAFDRAINRVSYHVVRQFKVLGGRVENLGDRLSGITVSDQAYLALQEMARQSEKDGDPVRAGAIREALDAIDERAVGELEALCTKHGIAAALSIQATQRPPVTTGPSMTVAAIPPPAQTPVQFDWIAAYRQLRDLSHHFADTGWDRAHADFNAAARRIETSVTRKLKNLGENPEHLLPLSGATTKPEPAYRAIQDMCRRASESGDAARTHALRRALDDISLYTACELDELTTKYGALDALSAQAPRAVRAVRVEAMRSVHAIQATAMQPLPAPARVGPTTSAVFPVTVMPPVTGGAAQVPVTTADPGSVGHLVQVPGAPGLPPVSGLSGPSLFEAAGARAGDLGRGWLDPSATASGTTATEPVAIETIVTPSLGGASSFWLQPADPVPAPGSVPFDSGLHHAGVAVRPPPDADPWGIRPPGIGAETPPVAFDPRSAPPGPGSRAVYTGTIRTPVLSDGAPPGWQGAETPSFARAASGADELPFLHRQRMAHRFRTDDALIEAEHALQTGSADALGWSDTRWREMINDLYWLNAIVQLDSAAAAARVDVDWRAIEALVRILDAPPVSP